MVLGTPRGTLGLRGVLQSAGGCLILDSRGCWQVWILSILRHTRVVSCVWVGGAVCAARHGQVGGQGLDSGSQVTGRLDVVSPQVPAQTLRREPDIPTQDLANNDIKIFLLINSLSMCMNPCIRPLVCNEV